MGTWTSIRSKSAGFDQTKWRWAVELFLDPDDPRSNTRQLYEQIRDAIDSGGLEPGDRLTPTRTVAAELRIARSSVTEVYERLTAEGHIEGRAGGGSFVLAGADPVPSGPPPAALEPLFRMDRDGRVIYIGTFSKTLGAAVRAGFLVTPPTLAPAITAVRQAVDWCPPPLIQDALTALIAGGHFGRHLRRARAAYSRRRDRLCRELRARLPAGYHPLPAQAGLHLTVVGPGTPPDAAFDGLAEDHGILLSSLRRTYQRRHPRDGFLVGFGGLPTADVTPAITGLCAWLSGERPR
ncbi:aminotransferase class I/II-fold pyridoxal phosphate-dependent enzyme [Dactylosporangium sp. NPDC006015]|uniref:aminotransferase class I/II-fold pyridoxal phosphate-dependent enzyme n=1 Tax=Dactylosporangium sp. NPDC006015 TaxID=3154576 RepID=UPI0033B31E09